MSKPIISAMAAVFMSIFFPLFLFSLCITAFLVIYILPIITINYIGNKVYLYVLRQIWRYNMSYKASSQAEETRKLQITGGSTYILSLPKPWVTQNQLKKGSALLVREEDDGSLSIAPSKFEKREKQDEAFIRISTNDNPDAVMRTA